MLNSVILMGRLTADPELRTTSGNLSMVTFSVAVERNYQSQGQEKQTDFINCIAWRHNAEFISRYFRKWQMIAIQGSIQQDSYEDKATGAKRSRLEVLVDRAHFCGSKSETYGQNSDDRYPSSVQQPTSYQNSGSEDFSDIAAAEDDLPF